MPHRAGIGIVHTKLRVPELPSGIVERARLRDRLSASTQRAVLVSGPAGFGKTVLVVDWLRSSGCAHAWLSLDDLDNDAKRFLNHLAAALRTLSNSAAQEAAGVLDSLRAGADLTQDAELIGALHALGPGTVLVLDDVHVLESDASLHVLASLLDARVAGPRLVLLTRTDPPLPFARLRVAGELLEVREQDLRFNLDEALDLFATLLPGGLDEDLVRSLERRTEGWIAGLRMAAIALEAVDDRRAVVDAFTGSHRFVADYLIEEAVGRQSEQVRQFLMETSMLPRFTEDTCVAVTGRAEARTLLHQVEAANLFLVPLGVDRQWFRYHHLFAELLQYRLRRLHPDRVDELHERASRWFEESDDIASAIELATRMSTPERAAVLLDRHAFVLLARSEVASLVRWAQHVPEAEREKHPTLLLSIGWTRVLNEREPDLTALFASAERLLAATPADCDARRTDTLRSEFQILRAYLARFTGRYEEALRIGAEVLDNLPADGVALRGRILFNQARAHMMLCDMARAAELLERSVQENLRADTQYLVLTGLAQSAAVLLETAGVPRAMQALEAALRLAEERRLTRLPAFAIVQYHVGHVHAVADELEAAVPWFERAIGLGRMSDMPEARANGLVGLARVRAAQGRFEEAEDLLLEAEAMARTTNIGLIEWDVSIPRRRHMLYVAAAAAGSVPLNPLPRRTGGAAAARWTVLDEASELCAMIESLRSGDAAGAAASARTIVEQSLPRGRHIACTVARVVQAIVAEGDARWPILDAALADAAARRYVRPLLETGPPLRPLLQAALSQPLSRQARAHARLLLDHMPAPGTPDSQAGAHVSAAAAMHAAHVPAMPAPVGAMSLTDRERDVLVQLCRGLSNKAIARTMFVSPETVKTHLKHIYDKLDVTRRGEAASRARALGLVASDDPQV